MLPIARHRRGMMAVGLLTVLVGSLAWRFHTILQEGRRNQALFAAIKANKTEAVRTLLQQGADPNATENGSHNLSWRDFLVLFQRRRTRARMGSTALIAAVQMKKVNLAILQLLLDKGADPNTRDVEGNPILICALLSEYDDYNNYPPSRGRAIQMLLQRGADPNARDADGRTAIYQTCYLPDIDALKALLEDGVDINVQDKTGFTPLMAATECGHDGPLDWLLKKGADVTIRDKKGNTVLACAMSNKQYYIAERLRKAGAKN